MFLVNETTLQNPKQFWKPQSSSDFLGTSDLSRLTLVLVSYCHCTKILQEIILQEKVHFAHSSGGSSPRLGRPVALGLWWGHQVAKTECMMEQSAHLSPHDEEAKGTRRGQGSHDLLQGHAPKA
jgi:hypothetical protein